MFFIIKIIRMLKNLKAGNLGREVQVRLTEIQKHKKEPKINFADDTRVNTVNI